jgi:hypothetical protein
LVSGRTKAFWTSVKSVRWMGKDFTPSTLPIASAL